MQFFLRYAYAPLFWSGFIGLATWQVGYRQASHAWLVALFLGALGLSFLAERRLPYQPRWNRPHADRLRDVLHASVNESLNALGILALPLLAGVLSFWPVWPQAWPLWLQLLLAIDPQLLQQLQGAAGRMAGFEEGLRRDVEEQHGVALDVAEAAEGALSAEQFQFAQPSALAGHGEQRQGRVQRAVGRTAG